MHDIELDEELIETLVEDDNAPPYRGNPGGGLRPNLGDFTFDPVSNYRRIKEGY